MDHISEHIRVRRSIRTFDGRALDENIKKDILAFAEAVENPFNIPISFKLLDAKEHGLTSPVINGTDLYIAGKIQCVPHANVAFGYAFEAMILYAQSLRIGTVWIGGTMNRPAFEKAMELDDNEMMPCATPLGYPAKKMSLKESMMRKTIKADVRDSFEELFFLDSLNTPLTEELAGRFLQPLEMVRLAPSAVNKQPWRVVIKDNAAHFYLQRSKGFGHDLPYDMQMIDIGIAMCHFDLAAKEQGIQTEFVWNDPKLSGSSEPEYIGTYIVR